MEDNEIIKTRTGGLGSSDAKMIATIGKNGCVSDAAEQRLAIMLGLEQPKQFSTVSTANGNYIESCLFQAVQKLNSAAISNPYTESEMFSKYGFKIFNHIDFELIKNDTLVWFECKAVNDSIDETKYKYREQLALHYLLGKEKAKKLNLDFLLYLAYYQTETKDCDFDGSNIVLLPIYYDIERDNTVKNIFSGIEIIAKALSTFTYNKKEELSAYNLPEETQDELDKIALFLREIEEREAKIDTFKEKMTEIMLKNNVKSIKNDLFSITLVAATNSMNFDKKAFEKAEPEMYAKFKKAVEKKAFIKIKLKE